MTEQTLRLFVSSPGDVFDERQRIGLVVDRLNAEFKGRVQIEAVRWETSFYSSHETFQKQIPEAADCDVVVGIFKSRLGTPLPAGFPLTPLDEPYPSGTAYEVLTAIEARKSGKDQPDIYVFRFPNAPSVELDAPDRAEIEAQWESLKKFFDTWFKSKAGGFVAAFHSYSSTDDFAVQAEECLRQWLARRGFVVQGPVWDRVLRGSPFPGLSAFDATHGSVFFGRGVAIEQAVRRLRRAGEEGGDRAAFLLVIGASGSGKSSLLRAGLLPRLTLPGAIPQIDLWRMAVVTPGTDPFLSLAEALLADNALGPELRDGIFSSREMLAKQLAGDVEIAVAPLRDALGRAAAQRQREAKFDTPRPARVVVAVDQAERLFLETGAQTATAFADLLAVLVRKDLIYLIMALRSDAYTYFQAVDFLVSLRRAGVTFDLVPPSLAELEEIVTRPVAACRPTLVFEETEGRSLASQLVVDAKGGDALPLLQMTLSRLYAAEAQRQDGFLRFADYHGMDRAVTETANEALDTLTADARSELPALVASLVSDVVADPVSGAPVPVIVSLDRGSFETGKPARAALIDSFVGKRLLTTEGDGVSRRVRPVHEALLRIWPQAVAIVGEVGQLIRVRHMLEPVVREWLAAAESAKAGHLELSPALLDGAQRLLARFGDDVPRDMRSFISQAAAVDAVKRDRERQDQERRVRDAQALADANRRTAQRTLVGLGAALVLLVIAVAVSIYAERERTRAEFALGRGLWGELDFSSPNLQPEEIDVLWQVATSSAAIRSEFIAPLTAEESDPGVVLRFARRPEAVLRAIGIGHLSQAQTNAAMAQVLDALSSSSDPAEMQGLARAAATLAARPTAAQLAKPLAAILKALSDPANFAHLRELGSALDVLAASLSPEQAQDAQKVALAGLMLTTSPDQVAALASALRALARRLNSTQVAPTLSAMLSALRSTADARQIAALATVAQVLAGSLTPAQAQTQLDQFLESLRGTIDPVALDSFARSVQAIIDRLSPEQAAAQYPSALKALANPTDYGHLQAVGQAVLAIARKLPAEQAAPMLASLLTALSATTDPDQTQALAAAVGALAPKVVANQVAPTVKVLGASIIAISDATSIKALALALRAFPTVGATDETAAATAHVLDLMTKTTDIDELSDLAQAIDALPGALPSSQASEAIAPVLKTLGKSTDPAELASLVSAVRSLSNKLPPDVVDTTQKAVNGIMLQASDPDQLAALMEALQALPLALAPDAAHRAMAIVLKALADTTDPSEQEALATGIQSMAKMLDKNEAAVDLQPVLTSTDNTDEAATLSAEELASAALLMRLDESQLRASLPVVLNAFADTHRPAQLEAQAAIITTMSDRLSVQQVSDMAALTRWRLAQAGSQSEAAAWAETLVALAQRNQDTEGEMLLDALRYPTTAGRPTAIFLSELQERYPQAIMPNASLLETIKALDKLLGTHVAVQSPIRPAAPAARLTSR